MSVVWKYRVTLEFRCIRKLLLIHHPLLSVSQGRRLRHLFKAPNKAAVHSASARGEAAASVLNSLPWLGNDTVDEAEAVFRPSTDNFETARRDI